MQVNEKCLKCGRQIPWVCFFGNATLAVFKAVVGFLSGSRALIADGLHSASDVLATIMVIISLKISGKAEDDAHPWGYGKAEYIGSLFVYTILLFLGAYILIDSVVDIVLRRNAPPHMISLFAAMVSVAGNVIFSSYGFCAGKRLNSPAMIANANENRADMFSSVAVILGILGAHAGFIFADSVAAIVVGLIIIRMSVKLTIEALRGLMDKNINAQAIAHIRAIALKQRGVSGVDFIRARKLGGKSWIEIEIMVDPRYTVGQANEICSEVRSAILRRAVHIKEVTTSFTSDWSVVRKPARSNKEKSGRGVFGFPFKRKSPAVYSNAGRS